MSVANGAIAVMSTIVPSTDADSAAAFNGADDLREPGVRPAAAVASTVAGAVSEESGMFRCNWL